MRTGNAANRRLKDSKCWKASTVVGREHGHLLAVAQRFERRAHGDFGFAEAYVAAEQAVHGMRRFHVALDFFSGGYLIFGFGELEGVFEFALPVGVLRKRIAFGDAALGVELQQLVGHVAHFGFDFGLALGPGGAAEAVERRSGFAAAAVFLDQIHAGQRHVELGIAGVFEQHEVALLFALHDFAEAQETADAVSGVDHEVAGLEVGQICREDAELALGDAGTGDQIGRIEKIFRTDEGDRRIRENRAAADEALDQISVGHGSGEVGALGQIRRGGFVGREAQLEGHRVFAQDVGQTFELAIGGREEGHAIAGFDHVLGLGDGNLHASVESHRGARGDVRGFRIEIQLAEGDLPPSRRGAFPDSSQCRKLAAASSAESST